MRTVILILAAFLLMLSALLLSVVDWTQYSGCSPKIYNQQWRISAYIHGKAVHVLFNPIVIIEVQKIADTNKMPEVQQNQYD